MLLAENKRGAIRSLREFFLSSLPSETTCFLVSLCLTRDVFDICCSRKYSQSKYFLGDFHLIRLHDLNILFLYFQLLFQYNRSAMEIDMLLQSHQFRNGFSCCLAR